MRNKILYTVLGLALLALSACSDWLDVSPKEEVKVDENFEHESGFREALAGCYMLLKSTSLYGRELTYGMADVLAQQWGYLPSTDNHYDLLSYDYTSTNSEELIKNVWSEAYNVVANANVLIGHVDEAPEAIFTATNRSVIRGEAYALRAMMHFDLLRLFAPAPVVGADRRGIPYVTSYGKDTTAFSTVAVCLERILSDLATAASELKADLVYEQRGETAVDENYLQNRGYKLNYYAVRLLQARVHLYKGDFAAALEAAREIVGEPGSEPVAPFSLTTAAATDERLFDSELLFALEEGKMQDNIDVYFGESVIKNGITNSSTALSISINNRNKLFAQQDPADDDYRLKLWFQETNSATAVMPGKYVNVGCIPLIRLSELYYIAAECSANQGLAYLNTLRAHRGLAAMTEVTDLQAEIAKEYSKEFMCEGQMFYYYKRLGLKRIGVYRTVAIEPEEVYVIPLPDDELDFGLIE